MYQRPSRIKKENDHSRFDCGNDSLNNFLKKFAYSAQQSNSSVTYVVVESNAIIAYYSLSYGSVACADAPERVRKGMGKYPVPILLLARLAVDKRWQGKGLGYSLLQDALLRACQASEQAGLRAVVVDAYDLNAKAFYIKYGFCPSPLDEMRLFLLMKDLKHNLGLD